MFGEGGSQQQIDLQVITRVEEEAGKYKDWLPEIADAGVSPIRICDRKVYALTATVALDIGDCVIHADGKLAYFHLADEGSVWTLQGNRGSAGVQGVQGIQGPAGHSGPVGKYGNRESEGPVGKIGKVGPIDPVVTGVKGIAGAGGPLGPLGHAGSRGHHGEQGVKGIKGPEGSVGPVGHQGIRGDTGLVGIRGDEDLLGRLDRKVMLVGWVLKDPKAVKDLQEARVCLELNVLKDNWDPRVLLESKVQWVNEQMLLM